MIALIGNKKIAFGAQVDDTQGDIFAMSVITLQSIFQQVPNEPS